MALIGSQRQLPDPLDGFHQLWGFAAATAILSGVIGSFIPRPSPQQRSAIEPLLDDVLAVEADGLPIDVDVPVADA